MATATGSFTPTSTVGTLYWKIKYRLEGDSVWASFNLPTSGTTYSFSALDNRIYDIQVVNVNGTTNPASAIGQGIGITDPTPTISPTNTSVEYTFNNLSNDMDTYTTTIAEYATPGNIIATHILSAVPVVTDTFTGLDPLTEYTLTITPAANTFTKLFTYTFTTESVFACASPSGSMAILS